MIEIKNTKEFDLDAIPIDPFWNVGDEKELRMHRIHAYPAKFPSFITTKALKYAEDEGIESRRIADIFCGCGTVALEAKRSNIPFWGCDINPVATLIAKAKSNNYQTWRLLFYFDQIIEAFKNLNASQYVYRDANDRIKYWYSRKQFNDLSRLKEAIESTIPNGSKYSTFFLCAYSNILKPSSRWLTKSIKPQIDPNKPQVNVIDKFKEQCEFSITANEESDATHDSEVRIVKANILSSRLRIPKVDMIVTSPPYVTSYEYADLHQLSLLWLGHVEDYKEQRTGSIGSLYHDSDFTKDQTSLNSTGRKILDELLMAHPSKAKSVAKYYVDMQRVAKECYDMLNPNGMALFVIGNTEYAGVRINNAGHLAESLADAGFKKVLLTKRKISKKILTPYRDNKGRFTTDAKGRKVYGEEFIIIGRR
ncbi:MAG: DNA adenine methylase [Candidatus Thorarchaeota archaeon]